MYCTSVAEDFFLMTCLFGLALELHFLMVQSVNFGMRSLLLITIDFYVQQCTRPLSCQFAIMYPLDILHPKEPIFEHFEHFEHFEPVLQGVVGFGNPEQSLAHSKKDCRTWCPYWSASDKRQAYHLQILGAGEGNQSQLVDRELFN